MAGEARALPRPRMLPDADTMYRRALAEWDGDALEEFSGEVWAHAHRARLTALRTSATEEHIDVRLAAGRHAELVAELEAAFASDPSRERIAAELMVALYRCARQVDALAVAEQARRDLAEEHGVEPGDVLREIEYRVLYAVAELDLRPGLETDAGCTPLRGAEPERRAIRRPRRRTRDPRRRLERDRRRRVPLRRAQMGEPGIGKTRLVLGSRRVHR